MPRLNKVIPNQHTGPAPTCTYDPTLRGFFIGAGSERYYIQQHVSEHGRALGYDPIQGEMWFLPEIFWTRVKAMARELRSPGFTEGVTEFTSSLQVEIPHGWDKVKGVWTTEKGTELRPYQQDAVRRLLAGSLLLGDDMGLGKTLSTLWAFILLLAMNKAKRLVVFVPNEDVAHEWVSAYRTHIAAVTSQLFIVKSRKYLGNPASLITLIPYSKIHRADYSAYVRSLCQQEGTVLCMDEAHRVSGADSLQHRAALEYSHLVQRVWLLTGSEVRDPNLYYGLYKIVNRLGSKSYLTFDTWCKYYSRGRSWNPERLKELSVLRKGFAMRRVKEDVCKELPPLTMVMKPVAMHPLQEQLYKQMERDKEIEIAASYGVREMSEQHFFTVYLRLMQLAAHPMLLDETRIPSTPKIDAILDSLEDVGDQKVLIWSNWPRVIDFIYDQIKLRLPQLRVAKAHGGVSKEDRHQAKEALQAGELDVVVANPCVWGEGQNLQAASILIYHDYHPSSTRWEQSLSRSHRMGQTKPVTCLLFLHMGSIESKILGWLREKKKLATIITGGR